MTSPACRQRPRAAVVVRALAVTALAVAALGASAAFARTASATTTVSIPPPAAAALPAAAPRLVLAGSGNDPAHGPYGITTDTCARCHRAHTGRAASMTTYPSQKQLCLSCHDGTGSTFNVAAQYSDPSIPVNDAATRSYYSHDPNDSTDHSLALLDEFTGVSNRHSQCVDCHNSHAATTGKASQASASSPWKPSGALAAISGLSVSNGASQTTPTYTFLDGESAPLTAEYQLCFKCHSGNTILPSNTGFPASQYLLDKGIELNPANPSFHPIEAQGKNQTAIMQVSLTDVYGSLRRWTLSTTSTIRCTSCHTGGPAVTSSTTIDGDQPVHVSPNRGILIAKYQDRVLMSKGVAYSSSNFALCFSCHSERPFATSSTSATSFNRHRLHVAGLDNIGNGSTDIDSPGAGQGNAICSECHFRLHSTAFAVGTLAYPRLVNFAPDVLPYNGVLRFTTLPVDSQGRSHGTCTLTCHGYDHDGKAY